MSGQGQRESAAQGSGTSSRRGGTRGAAGSLRLVPVDPGSGPQQDTPERQANPVLPAAVRVRRSLLGLRRDALHQAVDAAVWRSRAHRQRDRMHLDLWRQSPDHPVRIQRRRPRPSLVELPVRGQCRVRLRPASRREPTDGRGQVSRQVAGKPIAARAGRRPPRDPLGGRGSTGFRARAGGASRAVPCRLGR